MTVRTLEQTLALTAKLKELNQIGDDFDKAIADTDAAYKRVQVAREAFGKCFVQIEKEFGTDILPGWIGYVWGPKPQL